jgi:DNA-binding PadR family transcriptional regulator
MHHHHKYGGRHEGFPGFFAMRGGRGFGFGPGGFEFSFGDGRGGRWGGHGRGRRRMFEGGELRLVLLKLIADEPRHGYDLIRAIEELTGGDYAPSPGVVYPTLTLLQDMGLIEEGKSEAGRKSFQATAEGRAHLEEKADEVEALFERLAEHGEHRSRADRAPIKRAVANLMSALWHKVAQEGADDERLHQVAEILDEAARKIERLK